MRTIANNRKATECGKSMQQQQLQEQWGRRSHVLLSLRRVRRLEKEEERDPPRGARRQKRGAAGLWLLSFTVE